MAVGARVNDARIGVNYYITDDQFAPFGLGDVSIYVSGEDAEFGLNPQGLFSRSMQPFGEYKGDLGATGKDDLRIYLPAALPLYYSYGGGEEFKVAANPGARRFMFKVSGLLLDHDPRNEMYANGETYGNSAQTLAKYLGLNRTDVGVEVSLRYYILAPDLSVYVRASYNPITDVNPDITEPTAFENTKMNAVDVVAGVEAGHKDIMGFAQLQLTSTKPEAEDSFTKEVGLAAGVAGSPMDELRIGASAYYYWLEQKFTGSDNQLGLLANIAITPTSGVSIIPYFGWSWAEAGQSVGTSSALTKGDRSFTSEREVVEAGVRAKLFGHVETGCAYTNSDLGVNPSEGESKIMCGFMIKK